MDIYNHTRLVKIHTRTLLILGATIFVLIFAINLLAQFFILSSYAQIEREESITNVQRVVDQIAHEQSLLGNSARDLAIRDSSYQFIEDRNQEFYTTTIASNSTYENLRINGLFYYDTNGNLVAGRWYDLQASSEVPVPESILIFFENNQHLFSSSDGNSARNGLVLLPEGPVLVSLSPVQPSSRIGPGNGTLVMVRTIGQDQVAVLESLTHRPVSLSVLMAQSILLDPDLANISGDGTPVIVTHPTDGDTIAGYTLVRDINDLPILILRVDTPRYVYQKAMATVVFLASMFILIGIIYVVITELLLRRYLINPLLGLDDAMKTIGCRRDLSERLPVRGDDEIASLKNTLNSMLQELQDKEKELAQRREMLAEANRKANLYLDIYLDVLTYEILNSTMCIRGYADLLRVDGGKMERLYAQRITDTINREGEVIQNVETISKIFKHPPARGPVDLDEIIWEVMTSYPGTAVRYESCGKSVLADPMLSRVFHNIIANSVKFGGSDVKIEITYRDAADGMAEISLTDTGPGIPDAQKPGVFDRFMQGSEKRSSYGLGLHIAKMLVEAYGGRIWADDRITGQYGEGAAIRFTLQKGPEL
ncbi:MAG: CHASE4 domain-containing protein [Methanoregula sp.]